MRLLPVYFPHDLSACCGRQELAQKAQEFILCTGNINGMDPARIGRYIAGIVEKKNPAVVYVAGAQYKFLSLLCKLLPAAARGKIVGKIYG